MMIQDIAYIETAEVEVIGATGITISNQYNNGFSTFNGFATEIKNLVNLGGAASASAGAVADASSRFSLLTYSKADSGARVTDGRSSSFSTSAAAIQYH